MERPYLWIKRGILAGAFVMVLTLDAIPKSVAPVADEVQLDPAMAALIKAADPAVGESVARICSGCHSFGRGEGPVVGPNLYGIADAPIGRAKGYEYSAGMTALKAAEATWSLARLDRFLTSPAAFVPETGMGFPGIADDNDRAALIAYLVTLSVDLVPLGDAGAPSVEPPLGGRKP